MSRSGALVLRGPAGIGKTALLNDALEDVADMQVLRGRGVESESELGFAALHQLLRPILDHADELAAPQANALRSAFGIQTGQADRFLISVAVLNLLAEAAERSPVVCVIDDAHWLDDASSTTLVFVARRLEAERIALLFAAREGEVRRFEAAGLAELYVSGLDEAAAEALLRHRAGADLAPNVRRRLIAATEGNPLALLELPSALSKAQLSGRDPLPVPLPLSDEMERAFRERARRLPPSSQTLLVVAAADDTRTLRTILGAARILGVDDSALDAAERGGLVRVRDGRLDFRHPLVSSALYQGATTLQRQAVHRALAQTLTDADADRRAWHLASATVEPDDSVARELLATADRARARNGFEAACAALERAAELTADAEPRARHLASAAENAWLSGQPQRASSLLENARSLASDALLIADIDKLRGVIEHAIGSPITAKEILVSAAASIAQTDMCRALEMLLTAASAVALATDGPGAAEIARFAATLNPTAPGDAYTKWLLIANGHYFHDELREATDALQKAVSIAEDTGDPALAADAAERAALFISDDDAAYSVRSQVVARSRAAGAIGNIVDSLFRLAQIELVTGRWTAALGSASEAVRLARETGQHGLSALPMGWLTVISAMRGDERQLRSLTHDIREGAGGHYMGAVEQLLSWAWGVFELGAGRPSEALNHLKMITHPGIRIVSDLDYIDASIHASEPRATHERLQSLTTVADVIDAPWIHARVAHCHALMEHGDAAERFFDEALNYHNRAHRPFERARTALAYGAFLRRTRRRIDARKHLYAALEVFESLGATRWEERARIELRASGQTARRRDPSTITDLTPQEIQVARFVARGLSNREVATQLFLSPRTIDFHLRNVFAKLGISSRTQLVHYQLD
jgi:DNA-binding CsgD family transcriptional regulator